MAKAFGIITSASNRYFVDGLQNYRPIAAFSFVGRYRLIDFPISCMSNSGIDRIFVFVNGNPRSLTEHLGSGRLYNINSKRGKLELLFHEAGNFNRLYNTDIAAFSNNIEQIERASEEYVVISSSNVVASVHYDSLLKQHIESGADISLLYKRTDNASECFLDCNTLNLNRQKGVQSLSINLGNQKAQNIFLGTYIMKKELFLEVIRRAKAISSMYQLSQTVSELAGELDIRGIQQKGFVAAVTDFKSYYQANLDLISTETSDSLFDPKWPIYTRTTDSCPTQFFEGGSVRNSLVSNGCSIEGTVENSVIGRGIRIGKGAVVKNCVILAYAEIGDGVHIENAVIDKWAKITRSTEIIADPAQPGYIKRNDKL